MESKNIILPKGEKRNILNPSMFSKNYMNPPIMDGYRYVEGSWDKGFVIERISDGSLFVWVPVGFLDCDDDFFYKKDKDGEFWDEWLVHVESLKKYGGYYISQNLISEDLHKKDKPQSLKGAKPWMYLDTGKAREVAALFESNSENLKSSLPFVKEYQLIGKWFEKTKLIKAFELWDQYKLGYMPLGSYKIMNNINDFIARVPEYAIPETKIGYAYSIQGSYDATGIYYFEKFVEGFSWRDSGGNTGFRIALYVKP
jgi:hypothetical protein